MFPGFMRLCIAEILGCEACPNFLKTKMRRLAVLLLVWFGFLHARCNVEERRTDLILGWQA